MSEKGRHQAALLVAVAKRGSSHFPRPDAEADGQSSVVLEIAKAVTPAEAEAGNRRPNQQRVKAADFNVHITEKRRKLLRESQFPNPVYDAEGSKITKPKRW